MHTRLKINWKYKLWLLLALTSCSSDIVDYGYGKYYVEFATALENHAFRLDSGQTIYDSNQTAKQTFAVGDRVFLYFSYGNTLSDPVTIHGSAKIFSDALKSMSEDAISQQANEPVRFQSAWVGSHYLNMHIYIEYRSKAHRVALVVDEEQVDDSEIHLYLRHDKNDDPPGYPSSVYASYDLSKVLGEPQGDRSLIVHFNTTNYGEKISTFKY